jgi:hypothetical protein
MTDGEPKRRMTRAWAITLLAAVLVLFVGGGALAALAFVTTLNARPLQLSCTVVGTFGDIDDPAAETGKPGYSVQTENVADGEGCDDFYVRDPALRQQIEVGESYVFTITNLIGYSNVEAVEPYSSSR